MNEKQITSIAYNRAWKKLKPFVGVLLTIFLSLFVVSFVTNNQLLVFPMAAISVIMWSSIFVKTNEIKGEIIKNKDTQVITEEDIKGISVDKVMKTNKYWLLTFAYGFIITVGWWETSIPTYYRYVLVSVGILGAAIIFIWVRRKSKSFREQIKKDFNK